MSKVQDVMRIDGIFYDTKKMAAMHPGGELYVLMNNCQDATAFFISSHRKKFPHDRYKHLQVDKANVDRTTFTEVEFEQDFTDYLELCEAVKPVLQESGGFAPWYYWIKCFLLLATAFYCDFTSLFFGPSWPKCFLMGITFAWIGLNVMHDSNHGALSRNPQVNRVLGFTQDYIGGNGLMWLINHDICHHIFSNDPARDHDITMPLLRLHNRTTWHPWYAFQQLYVPVLQAIFGPFHVLVNQIYIWQGPAGSQHLLKDYWFSHLVMSFLFPARALIGYYLWGWPYLRYVIVAFCFGGVYLGFFFIISHNFIGTKWVDSTKGCWLRNQVETACSVGGFWLENMNGGLNLQIEHHLFPRVNHYYYHLLQPIVMKFCEKKGIHYTAYAQVTDNAVSTFKQLTLMGQNPKAVN